MTRTRAQLSSVGGGLLLVVAACTPCLPLANWAGGGLPYQDPTPEMLAQQAAEQAAAGRSLLLWTVVAVVLGVAGAALLVIGIRSLRKSPH